MKPLSYDLTVAICTRNRSASLRRAIQSIARSEGLGDSGWELLIVDNGSIDTTPDVVAEFSNLKGLRRVIEPQAGLSHARNRAVAESRGAWILWTDDDVTVERSWLAAYLAAISLNPGLGVLGGPVIPVFDQAPPPWVLHGLPVLQSAFSGRSVSDVPRVLNAEGELPYGANMAIRRDLARSHPFDPRLGAAPGRAFGLGEETAVLRSILAEGAHGLWLAHARVTHHIAPARTTRAHLDGHFESAGRGATGPVISARLCMALIFLYGCVEAVAVIIGRPLLRARALSRRAYLRGRLASRA